MVRRMGESLRLEPFQNVSCKCMYEYLMKGSENDGHYLHRCANCVSIRAALATLKAQLERAERVVEVVRGYMTFSKALNDIGKALADYDAGKS